MAEVTMHGAEIAWTKHVSLVKTKTGYSARCKKGLWRVDATTKAQAEKEGRYYFVQYFMDGEYAMLEENKEKHKCAKGFISMDASFLHESGKGAWPIITVRFALEDWKARDAFIKHFKGDRK